MSSVTFNQMPFVYPTPVPIPFAGKVASALGWISNKIRGFHRADAPPRPSVTHTPHLNKAPKYSKEETLEAYASFLEICINSMKMNGGYSDLTLPYITTLIKFGQSIPQTKERQEYFKLLDREIAKSDIFSRKPKIPKDYQLKLEQLKKHDEQFRAEGRRLLAQSPSSK